MAFTFIFLSCYYILQQYCNSHENINRHDYGLTLFNYLTNWSTTNWMT